MHINATLFKYGLLNVFQNQEQSIINIQNENYQIELGEQAISNIFGNENCIVWKNMKESLKYPETPQIYFQCFKLKLYYNIKTIWRNIKLQIYVKQTTKYQNGNEVNQLFVRNCE